MFGRGCWFDAAAGGAGYTGGGAGAPAAIILAAGKGKRMQSDLPKVLHPVGGRPMVRAVIDACRAAGCGRIVLVVGHGRELVRDALADEAGIEYAVQDEQLGTGHAVLCARWLFEGEIGAGRGFGGDVFVLAGDGPLIRAETLRTLLGVHRDAKAAATLATSVIEDPAGYGRIVRDAGGSFVGIVEQKNASAEQLSICEVNPSYYCFDVFSLFDALSRVGRDEVSGEYYVTDVPAHLLRSGERVEVVPAVPAEDVLSINTLEHLAEVDRIYRLRGGVGGDGGVSSGVSSVSSRGVN